MFNKKEYMIKYRKENKEKIKTQKAAYDKIYRLKKHKIILKNQKIYRLNNKEKIKISRHIHRLKNHKEIDRKNQIYINKREKIDPGFKITNRLRHRVGMACKGKNAKKNYKFKEYIGCSISDLLNHLESKFSIGMNLNNYGKWHIDHIIPCSKFDLTNPEQQRVCFHYTNLQPMWAIDNIKKGDKYNE